MKDQIIEMLGRGIPATQVAAAVGCDDSYISQLLASEEVSQQVSEAKAKNFSAFIAHDNDINAAEEAALKKVVGLVPFITKPSEAVRVFSVLNAAKRRTADAASNSQAVAQTVSLELPAAARVRFTLTQDKQVIEIEGRSMATLPAKSLAARLEQRNAARLLTSEIPASLPFTVTNVGDVPLVEKL
jgi:hypothetical protein